MDLLVETDKSVYVAGVKVKPRHSDAVVLLAKAETAAERYRGKGGVVPVLADAMIGSEVEVEEYALRNRVKVYGY